MTESKTENKIADIIKQKTNNKNDITTTGKQKRHRNRPDLQNFGEEYVEPGDNARYLRHALVSLDLPPIDISDPKQVESRIREYFNYCIDNDRKPNMIGLANWLGVSRDTLNSWKRGEYRTQSHSDLIKKALDVLEELWMDYMLNGKANPASLIFIGKNLWQYKDQTDVVVTPNNPLDSADAETARKKYVDALPESTED